MLGHLQVVKAGTDFHPALHDEGDGAHPSARARGGDRADPVHDRYRLPRRPQVRRPGRRLLRAVHRLRRGSLRGPVHVRRPSRVGGGAERPSLSLVYHTVPTTARVSALAQAAGSHDRKCHLDSGGACAATAAQHNVFGRRTARSHFYLLPHVPKPGWLRHRASAAALFFTF